MSGRAHSLRASSHKTPATFPTGQLNRWCVCFEHIVGLPTTVRSTYHGAFPPLPRNCSRPSAMTAGKRTMDRGCYGSGSSHAERCLAGAEWRPVWALPSPGRMLVLPGSCSGRLVRAAAP